MKSFTLEQFRKRFVFDQEQDPFATDEHINVFQAADKELHRDVAIKIIRDDALIRRYPSLKDLAGLFKLQHGHLVHFFDFLRVTGENESEPGFDVVIMDFISGGDFSQLKGNFLTEENRTRIVEGIVSALGVLHQHGIFHGNLKPGNVLFQDIGHLHVRVSDYGFVVTQEYETTGNQYSLESIQYLAPEQIEPESFARRGKVRNNADFWALGMLVYELYTGKYAFGEAKGSSSDLMTKILHADLPKDIDHLPENYAELVRACLVRDAAKRPSKVDELRKILDGQRVWRDGKMRKKEAVGNGREMQSSRPTSSPTPPIICTQCQTENPSQRLVCKHCRTPLRGPVFLKKFKRTGKLGFKAVLFLTLSFAALGFLYYQFYNTCDWSSGRCDKQSWTIAVGKVFGIGNKFKSSTEFASIPENNISDGVVLMLGLLSLSGFFAGIFFVSWFSRINANLKALGSDRQRYDKFSIFVCAVLFAIGIFILPPIGLILLLASLIFPVFVFQEAWRGSNPNFLGGQANWKKSRGSIMIFIWWIASIALPVFVLLPFIPSLPGSHIYQPVFFINVGLIVAYWLLSVLLVIRLNRRQLSKFRAWLREGNSQSPQL